MGWRPGGLERGEPSGGTAAGLPPLPGAVGGTIGSATNSEVGRRQWASGCGGSGSGGGQKQQQQRNDETITMRMIGKSDGAFLVKALWRSGAPWSAREVLALSQKAPDDSR